MDGPRIPGSGGLFISRLRHFRNDLERFAVGRLDLPRGQGAVQKHEIQQLPPFRVISLFVE